MLRGINDVLKLLVGQVGKDALLCLATGGKGADLLAVLGDGEALAGDLLLAHRLGLQGSGVLLYALDNPVYPAVQDVFCTGLLCLCLLVGIRVGLATGLHGLKRSTAPLQGCLMLGSVLNHLLRFCTAQTLETLNLCRDILLFKDGHQRLHLAFWSDRIPRRTLALLELLLCNVVPRRHRGAGGRLLNFLGANGHQGLFLHIHSALLGRSFRLLAGLVRGVNCPGLAIDRVKHLLAGLGEIAILDCSVYQHVRRSLGLQLGSFHYLFRNDFPRQRLVVGPLKAGLYLTNRRVVLLLCKSACVGALGQHNLLAGFDGRQVFQ